MKTEEEGEIEWQGGFIQKMRLGETGLSECDRVE